MITVLGARGFIGSHLLKRLQELQYDCYAPGRDESLTGRHLGIVFYCIGLTADFRTRPFDTIDAHIRLLSHVLERASFDRLIYLSSARVYIAGDGIAYEDDALQVNPRIPGDLYNLSKATGEAIALASGRNTCSVRLSNVYGNDFGSDNFLSSILRDAVDRGHVTLRTTMRSAKDYVSIEDVTRTLVQIGLRGRHQTYNLASGKNLSNAELAAAISRIAGCRFQVEEGSPEILFRPISTQRIIDEFQYTARDLLTDLPQLVHSFRHRQDSALLAGLAP